jgi:hypothetical protein
VVKQRKEGTVSRRGQLWRGELALQIEAYLAGTLTADDLVVWGMDHPFFDDQLDLDRAEVAVIGRALGAVLQRSPEEPLESRTTDGDLAEIVRLLRR